MYLFHAHWLSGKNHYDMAYEDSPSETFGDVYGDLNDNVELQVAQNPYYESEVETHHNSIRIPNNNMNDMEVITTRENDYYEM